MDYEDDRTPADGPRAESPNVFSFADAKTATARKQADKARERADEAERKAREKAEEAARKARERAEEKEREARERAEHAAVVSASAVAWMHDRDVHFCEQTNSWWMRDRASGEWATHPRPAMLNINPHFGDTIFASAMHKALHEGNRWFRKVTATFRPVASDVLNILEADFCPPAEGEPHPVFDVLTLNLGNGDAEAQAHIEKLALAKWSHPDNPTLPYLCFHDTSGGSGKSLLCSTALTTVFGGPKLVADNISMGDLTAKFNAQLVGKAFIHINESVEDKVDDQRIKMIAGSRTFWVEPKGVQKYEVDNTFWCIVSGNSPMGSVRVSNSAIDRRFSIIKTGGPLVNRVKEAFSMPDVEAARQWIATEGVRILSDRAEVGRWLRKLSERHGDVRDVPAFHGRDYQELVRNQRPFHESIFESLFRDPAFDYIRKPHLYQLYADLCRKYNNGYGLLRNRSFYAALDVWKAREGVDLAERKVTWTRNAFAAGPQVSTADIIYNPLGTAATGKVQCNDLAYGTEAGGRWDWFVQPA